MPSSLPFRSTKDLALSPPKRIGTVSTAPSPVSTPRVASFKGEEGGRGREREWESSCGSAARGAIAKKWGEETRFLGGGNQVKGRETRLREKETTLGGRAPG